MTPQPQSHRALVAFGANLGDTQGTFQAVLAKLESTDSVLDLQASELFTTHPVGSEPTAGDYTNAVFALTLSEEWTPVAFLHFLLEIEQTLGRTRQAHWESRCVDLDLLLFDDVEIHDFPQLILPHPLMPWRRFVLEPALQVAADWIHPSTGRTISGLFHELSKPQPQILRLSMALPAEWDRADCVINDTLEDCASVQAWARERHLPYLDCRDVFRGSDEAPNCDLVVQIIQEAYGGK